MALSAPDAVERFIAEANPMRAWCFLDDQGRVCPARDASMIRLSKWVGKGVTTIVVDAAAPPAAIAAMLAGQVQR